MNFLWETEGRGSAAIHSCRPLAADSLPEFVPGVVAGCLNRINIYTQLGRNLLLGGAAADTGEHVYLARRKIRMYAEPIKFEAGFLAGLPLCERIWE
jgi:hypothetical protein